MTTTLAEHGFLSAEIRGVAEVVSRRYAPWLHLVRSINAHAVKAQYEANVHSKYLPELIGITAYMRTLTHVQAAVLLLIHGMDVPARVLLRAALESLFKLKAVGRVPNEVVNPILAGDDEFRENLFENLKKLDNAELQGELEKIAKQPPSEATQKLKEWGVRKLSAKKMAEKAGLFDLYLTAYPVLSDSTHAGIRDLERHLETDGAGSVIAARNEPTVDGLELLFGIAADFLIKALEGHAAIFDMNVEQACEEATNALKALAANMKS